MTNPTPVLEGEKHDPDTEPATQSMHIPWDEVQRMLLAYMRLTGTIPEEVNDEHISLRPEKMPDGPISQHTGDVILTIRPKDAQ